jgi:hypothetical protein
MAAHQLIDEEIEPAEQPDPEEGSAPRRIILVLDPRTGELIAIPAPSLAALWSQLP